MKNCVSSGITFENGKRGGEGLGGPPSLVDCEGGKGGASQVFAQI